MSKKNAKIIFILNDIMKKNNKWLKTCKPKNYQEEI